MLKLLRCKSHFTLYQVIHNQLRSPSEKKNYLKLYGEWLSQGSVGWKRFKKDENTRIMNLTFIDQENLYLLNIFKGYPVLGFSYRPIKYQRTALFNTPYQKTMTATLFKLGNNRISSFPLSESNCIVLTLHVMITEVVCYSFFPILSQLCFLGLQSVWIIEIF